ncbi:uncharacterized protein LOC123507559 [Portunus trituberculatus]|uniref:Uncharacterized protein n=1 Tax=Portunus trituberculatus TaxID=210409 RepID=A0A5B7HV68_PORTR|nr:uncharacterized protein LOC123507559 [Portunus trituberculatus]MPC75292.1 hypothetical protein [Portunus trituberculatus]
MAPLRLILLVAVTCLLLAEARPRYLLVALPDSPPLVRHTRSLRQYQPSRPAPIQAYEQYVPVQVVEEESPEHLAQASDLYHHRADPYDHNDHVDYGAYTGGYGAFGWYSDHPVCINCGHYH